MWSLPIFTCGMIEKVTKNRNEWDQNRARTCWPGWNCDPRWRTMMFPGITYWSTPRLSANHSRRAKEGDGPENFLIPNRFPGDPPWFLTVPPARLVAVLTDPRPGFLAVSHGNERWTSHPTGERERARGRGRPQPPPKSKPSHFCGFLVEAVRKGRMLT